MMRPKKHGCLMAILAMVSVVLFLFAILAFGAAIKGSQNALRPGCIMLLISCVMAVIHWARMDYLKYYIECRCGYCGKAKKVGGLNYLYLAIFLCLGIFPAMWYVYRFGAKYVICPKCKRVFGKE